MEVFDQVLSFISKPVSSSFEEIAFQIFRFQFDGVPAYRRFCEERGGDPSSVRSVDEIPAVASVAFKYADLSLMSDAIDRNAITFLTSGTTAGANRRGHHLVPRPSIYRASAITHLRTMLYPDRMKTAMLAMHPLPAVMPESSLSTMIGWAIEEFGTGKTFAAASRDRVDVSGAVQFLLDTTALTEPVSILGTTAALSSLFDLLRARSERIHLATGSRIMDTGGAKGQAVPLTPAESIRTAGDLLGVAPEVIVNEYGMTELCSQLYDATPFNTPGASSRAERFKIAPPWMRVIARDPVTLKPVPDGAAGLLAFFDFANVGSVSSVMTEDIGIVENHRVRVIGRSSAASARGCALAIGQFAAAAGR
ncbi:MAG TPA: hypothetical protein VMU16_15265 [Candidatus Binataceae bacterium]|nr:hypothetical protein [Candidatus Binataceae bacterium]